MNQFESKVHALKQGYKAEKIRLCAERDQKMRSLKQLIASVKTSETPSKGEIIITLKQMIVLEYKECYRQICKAGRTYHFHRKAIQAEMMQFYA